MTVGEIESAAGLAPRRGGLYKHFESKTALVEHALAQRIERLKQMRVLADEVADVGTASVLRETAAAVLAELDEERELFGIFESDGDRFAEQRDRFFREIVQVGFNYARVAFETVAARHRREVAAGDLASVALSALVNHRRMQWTFGASADGLDDDRFLDAWITLVWSAIGPRADDANEHEPT